MLVEDVLEQLDGFLFLFADEFQLAQLLFGDPKGDLSRNSAVGRRAGTLIPGRVKGRLSGPFQSYGHGQMSPIGNTGRLHFPYDWNALPRQAASRLESFASTVVSSRSVILTRPVRSAGKLHDLKCRLISSDTRSPRSDPTSAHGHSGAHARRRQGANSLAPVRPCALLAADSFSQPCLRPLEPWLLWSPQRPRVAGSLCYRHACAPGQAVRDAQTQARRGGLTAGSVNSSWTVYGGQRGQSCYSCSRPWWSPRCGPAAGNDSGQPADSALDRQTFVQVMHNET